MNTESEAVGIPLFVRIADQIDALMGGLEGGTLPSERDLAVQFGVNRGTVRKAVAKLHSDGRLFRAAVGNRRLVSSPEMTDLTAAVCIPLTEYDYAAPGSHTDWSSAELMGANHIPIHVGVSSFLRETVTKGSVWLDLGQSLIGPESSMESLERLIRSREISGVVYWPVLPAPSAVREQLRYLQARMPLVLLDRMIWGFEADHCTFDCFEGGVQMGRHLLKAGHERFAFIGNTLPDFVHNYFRGIEGAIAEKGLSIPTENAFFIRNESLDLGYLLGPLMERPATTRPTVLVCANDTLALMALQWLASQRLSAPDDLAVTGVDDLNPVAGELLGLTTLRLSYQELGRAAAKLLFERISLPLRSAQPLTRLVATSLVVRRSCGG